MEELTESLELVLGNSYFPLSGYYNCIQVEKVKQID